MAETPRSTDTKLQASDSLSHVSNNSHTAQDYITTQLSLEADAREALPYQFDTCTKPLGPLRQSIYACLTCTPPPASSLQQFTPAGICYSCSISCHGEHNLVELFSKRNFVCDCGTTKYESSKTPCNLRINSETGRKGGVVGEMPHNGNKYNQNFQGKFCGCGEEYDPEKEKGTMFQCIGLGTVEDGGCGEDWWHPECLMKLPRAKGNLPSSGETDGRLATLKEEDDSNGPQQTDALHQHPTTSDNYEVPLPEGFPNEDDFDSLICYKCADAYPWIKQYANTRGFLTAKARPDQFKDKIATSPTLSTSSKRKAADGPEIEQDSKKLKADPNASAVETAPPAPTNLPKPKHSLLPTQQSEGNITLFLTEDFRDQLCRCPECFPRLAKHPQLLEEEDSYEPPLSESDGGEDGNGSVAGRSVNSGSLLDRGEAALSSMDRVRAIEGVMAYNHVRDKVKAFLQPFAESGQAVGAEDIKAYFAKLRGDEQAMREAMIQAESGVPRDQRREQDGY